MGEIGKQRVLAVTGVGLLLFCMFNSAFAAPPSARPVQIPAAGLAARLDLRPPTHPIESSENMGSSFPSMARRQASGPQQQLQLPALGSNGVQAHVSIQDWARQVHKEGLPVARLFESKSALVHLGFNPKGKPGLWLVQKTH
jgi:hypothetical protein